MNGFYASLRVNLVHLFCRCFLWVWTFVGFFRYQFCLYGDRFTPFSLSSVFDSRIMGSFSLPICIWIYKCNCHYPHSSRLITRENFILYIWIYRSLKNRIQPTYISHQLMYGYKRQIWHWFYRCSPNIENVQAPVN